MAMYKINLLLFLAVGLASALSPVKVERKADNLCVRGDGNPGYCVRRRHCSFIHNMYIQRKRTGIPFTPDQAMYLSDSLRCDHLPNSKKYVCCEEKEKIDQAVHYLATENCGLFGELKTFGGFEIRLMSRPWMALLYFRDKDGSEAFTCGGTLINKRYVLTAAHCFSNQNLLSVRLGEHNITLQDDCITVRGQEKCAPPVEDVGIERVFVHEDYNTKNHNDIALVKLSRDVEFKESIKPICLPTSKALQQNIKNIKFFHVTGWGRTETVIFSDVPMETIVNQTAHSKCQQFYGRSHKEIVSTQLCAGDLGRDACAGDSGGPLSYVEYLDGEQRFVEYGVVINGAHFCGNGNPGVYTNVGSYIRWIAHKIATK